MVQEPQKVICGMVLAKQTTSRREELAMMVCCNKLAEKWIGLHIEGQKGGP